MNDLKAELEAVLAMTDTAIEPLDRAEERTIKELETIRDERKNWPATSNTRVNCWRRAKSASFRND